jgi:CTP synthase
MKTIYEVPLALEEQGLCQVALKMLGVKDKKPDLKSWEKLVEKIKNPSRILKIGIAGKYTKLSDAYISVVEALKHAGYADSVAVEIKWINSEDCVDYECCKKALSDIQAVVVPGGFGVRGIEGKLNVIRYARENNLPFLGLCLGLQCAVIEYARNVLKLEDANSKEFDDNPTNPVIDMMLDQKHVKGYGGTMRLGAYDCQLKKGTVAQKAYGKDVISERHRHRYEVNYEYIDKLSKAGLVFSGMSPDGMLTEIIELPKLDWFVACQFHPEFKSRPDRPHPLFKGLVDAALKRIKQN